MTSTICDLDALEILDSRGRPTLQVSIELTGGVRAAAGVPSGASTGAHEAVEPRDGDPTRYGGRGVTGGVAAVRGPIRDAVLGQHANTLDDLAAVDTTLRTLDGTPNLASLGANAVLGTSTALVRAIARVREEPLWTLLSAQDPAADAPRLPVPHFNVVNGGAHARNELDFQEFMIAPLGAPSVAEAVRAGAEVYGTLRDRLARGGVATGLGDEGGFAWQVTRPEDVLTALVDAIEDAGYRRGHDGVAIALDPAANGFEVHGEYHVAGQTLSSTDMIDWYAELVRRFPIWSIEDGLGEDDSHGWRAMTAALGERIQIVGDDIFVTDPATIQRAADTGIANAALIKPNQIGTVTQTLQALEVCRSNRYAQMVSHRSGETCDDFIADLAVASGCGQLKSGAPARGERVAKYNRLLQIEHASNLPYGLVPRASGS